MILPAETVAVKPTAEDAGEFDADPTDYAEPFHPSPEDEAAYLAGDLLTPREYDELTALDGRDDFYAWLDTLDAQADWAEARGAFAGHPAFELD